MNPASDPDRGARDFARIVTWSSALSMGFTAGILASIRQVNPTIEFRFSLITVAAFLGMGFFTLMIFRRIFRGGSRQGSSNPLSWRWLVMFLGIIATGLIASMAFALRGVSNENRVDIVTGVGIALAVLTFGGWLGWLAVRFLEADEKRNKRDD